MLVAGDVQRSVRWAAACTATSIFRIGTAVKTTEAAIGRTTNAETASGRNANVVNANAENVNASARCTNAAIIAITIATDSHPVTHGDLSYLSCPLPLNPATGRTHFSHQAAHGPANRMLPAPSRPPRSPEGGPHGPLPTWGAMRFGGNQAGDPLQGDPGSNAQCRRNCRGTPRYCP